MENGTTGGYVVVDQALWRENPGAKDDDQGVGAFLQIGWADKRVSEVVQHAGLGFQWLGALPDRDDDVAGVMASWAKLSDEVGAGFINHHETAIELFYKIQINGRLSIKPDLQYIINPGGAGLQDAMVGTLRVEVTY